MGVCDKAAGTKTAAGCAAVSGGVCGVGGVGSL